MTPPIGNYSPVNSNLCDQNVTSTLDGMSQDLQTAPMSPMPPAPPSASQQASQSGSQSAAPQSSQINDIPMVVETIGVPIQSNIIDPYRRSGTFFSPPAHLFVDSFI